MAHLYNNRVSRLRCGDDTIRRVFFAAVLAAVAVSAFVVLYSDVAGTTTLFNQDVSFIPVYIADSNNAFAIDFYKQVSDDDSNIFFSPTSMYAAFSLLYEGAKNNTAEEIRNVFDFETDEETRHNNTVHMMSSINRHDPHAELDITNALWLAEWFTAPQSYLDVARGVYLTDVESIEFTGEKSGVKRINNWASDNTNNKINEIITTGDVGDLTAMIITNAVYFKGTWVIQFAEEETMESDFWKSDVASVRANFMNVHGIFNYTDSNGIQVLKMPYEGDRISMLVILPGDRNGIRALEESLSYEAIRKWNQDLLSQEVIVSIPKFTFEKSYDLIPSLKILGMSDVFDHTKSDLSGIAPDLLVDKALQKSFVEVNEEGTEAAAVTSIITFTISEPPPPIIFTADHPFIFLIQDDESGTILFMGRVSDPT